MMMDPFVEFVQQFGIEIQHDIMYETGIKILNGNIHTNWATNISAQPYYVDYKLVNAFVNQLTDDRDTYDTIMKYFTQFSTHPHIELPLYLGFGYFDSVPKEIYFSTPDFKCYSFEMHNDDSRKNIKHNIYEYCPIQNIKTFLNDTCTNFSEKRKKALSKLLFHEIYLLTLSKNGESFIIDLDIKHYIDTSQIITEIITEIADELLIDDNKISSVTQYLNTNKHRKLWRLAFSIADTTKLSFYFVDVQKV